MAHRSATCLYSETAISETITRQSWRQVQAEKDWEGGGGGHTYTLSNLQGHRARYLKRWPGLLLVPDPGSLSLLYGFLWASL